MDPEKLAMLTGSQSMQVIPKQQQQKGQKQLIKKCMIRKPSLNFEQKRGTSVDKSLILSRPKWGEKTIKKEHINPIAIWIILI